MSAMQTKTWVVRYEGSVEIGVREDQDPEAVALAYIPEGAEVTECTEQPQECDEMEDR